MTSFRASAIGEHVPYLRRYARAVTGSQAQGDAYAAATLTALIEGTAQLEPNIPLRIALFRVMFGLDIPVDQGATGHAGMAQKRLAVLTSAHRAALLLHSIEDLRVSDIALVMGRSVDDIAAMIARARAEIAQSIAGSIMIIEDEALIAMDLEATVSTMGHRVCGVARTRAEAVVMGEGRRPDLILADVQLADQSSGIDAVHDLLVSCGPTPVIFVTAYPELLLTGDKPEPAFLIPKPYTEDQVKSAVSQAMFFASSEGIVASQSD